MRVRDSILRDGDVIGFGRGSAVREGEVIQQRHLEFMLVLRLLKLRGTGPGRRDGPLPGAAASLQAKHPPGSDALPTGHICLPCRSHLFPPTGWDPRRAIAAAPGADLHLEWLHGYRCARGIIGKDKALPGRCENLHNAKLLAKGVAVYPSACCVVIYDLASHRQVHSTNTKQGPHPGESPPTVD